MYDFVCQITAGEKFPSFAFGFKPFDPTIFKYHLSVPKCMKRTVEGSVYSVCRIFNFASHVPVSNKFNTKEMTPEGGNPLGSIVAGRRGGGHVSAQLWNVGRKDLIRFK